MVLFFIFLIIVTAAVLFFRQLSRKKYNDFVLKNSIHLMKTKEINARYRFFPYKCFNQSHKYDNENYYKTISCTDYLIYQLRDIGKDVLSQIDKINSNKISYSRCMTEINALTSFGEFASPIGNLKLNKLIKTERALMKSFTYKKPDTSFYLTVSLYCSTLNGRIYHEKSEIFSAEDIYYLNKRLHNKRGCYYNDTEIWNALCRVERGKVSNKIRFSIYKRDGYQCRSCGAFGKYANLEIDHIIPISKGGRSTYDNLQTLCHKCNKEKSNNIYTRY